MLRIILVSCLLVMVAGAYNGYGSSGGSYGYGGNTGYGYGGKGGYVDYSGKGGYSGYGGYSNKGGYSGYGKGGGKDDDVDYLSQTFIPLSNPNLPDFTLTGRDTGSPFGSGLGLIAVFGAFAILFALTRN